jgi:hypothetical protein
VRRRLVGYLYSKKIGQEVRTGDALLITDKMNYPAETADVLILSGIPPLCFDILNG